MSFNMLCLARQKHKVRLPWEKCASCCCETSPSLPRLWQVPQGLENRDMDTFQPPQNVRTAFGRESGGGHA
jgi:hypothetical protein